jgi:hypothetical protein
MTTAALEQSVSFAPGSAEVADTMKKPSKKTSKKPARSSRRRPPPGQVPGVVPEVEPGSGELISRSELAARAGRTLQAVSYILGGRLAHARRGRRVLADDPEVLAWISEAREASEHSGEAPPSDDRAELRHRKLRAEVSGLELRHERLLDALISRELVRVWIFAALDEYHARHLQILPRTLWARVSAAVRVGTDAGEGEAMIRDLLAAELRAVKRTLIRRFGSSVSATSGPVPDVTPPTSQDDTPARALRLMRVEVLTRLRDHAVPWLTEAFSRGVARLAGPGGRFDRDTFESLQPAVAGALADVTRAAEPVITATVDDAHRAAADAITDEIARRDLEAMESPDAEPR